MNVCVCVYTYMCVYIDQAYVLLCQSICFWIDFLFDWILFESIWLQKKSIDTGALAIWGGFD